jgi:hypothetical protein
MESLASKPSWHARAVHRHRRALRSYGTDPYDSYTLRSGYYSDDDLYFPVQSSDDRFPNKDVVVGARVADSRLSIHKGPVRRRATVESKLGGAPLTIRWDDALDTAHVLHTGDSRSADFLDAMWFAWYAFYPTTQVLS